VQFGQCKWPHEQPVIVAFAPHSQHLKTVSISLCALEDARGNVDSADVDAIMRSLVRLVLVCSSIQSLMNWEEVALSRGLEIVMGSVRCLQESR
jgi:hypothetical protein